MATKQICLNLPVVLVVISRIWCSFGDSQSRFWMQLCVLVENQCEWIGSLVPVSCSGLSLRFPLCVLILSVPFCLMRKLLMKMLFCSSCLKVRHCLWGAFSRCGKMMRFREWVPCSLQACPNWLRFSNKPWEYRLSWLLGCCILKW